MKIVYIANIRLPTEKAHGIQIMNMCHAFAGLGHEVTLVVPNRKTHIEVDSFEYYDIANNFSILRTWTLDVVSWGRFGFILQSFTFLLSSLRMLQKVKPDIVYGRDELMLCCASFITPVVWETHTGAYNSAVRYLARKQVPIVAITQGLKDFYLERDVQSDSVLVAHDGVDLKRFGATYSDVSIRTKLGITNDTVVVGYIGKYKTVGHSKGIDELVLAFSEALQTTKNLHLLIVGPEEHEVTLVEALARSVGLEEKQYSIVTHVQSKEVPRYMQACDILVMNYPAVAHFSKFMSPLKLFEYLASGKAIIASDLPSIREVVSEKEVSLVKPSNHKELVESIIMLSGNAELREALGRAAKNLSMRYSWDARAKHILDFVNHVRNDS